VCQRSEVKAIVAAILPPEAEKSLVSQEYGWIRDATVRDSGEYLIATPRNSGRGSIIVLRKGTPPRVLYVSSADGSALFDPNNGERGLRGLVVNMTRGVTTVFNAGGRGHLTITDEVISLIDPESKRTLIISSHPRAGVGYVSYSAYDPSRAEWIEHVDVGPDGHLDLRRTEVAGGPLKEEISVAERWLERVNRDGRSGVMLDGQFMSVEDARASEERKARTGRRR
jgi:hypothetical protein